MSRKQASQLGLKPRARYSPLLEKSCLLLSANVSYENAAKDLKVLTGILVSHSIHQQRLVQRNEWKEAQVSESVETLSVDGGKVRLRTSEGKPSWRDYKAVTLHEQLCTAWLQDNEALVSWVNQQPLAAVVNCLGDGHDGVWNLIASIRVSAHRREILDWYHLVENLHIEILVVVMDKAVLDYTIRATTWTGNTTFRHD